MGKNDFKITEDGRIIRDSFVFYRSWYDTILMLPTDTGFQLFKNIGGYGFDGKEPEYDETLTPIFINIKPNIDANNKHARDGRKGGRPKKNDTERDDNFRKRKRQEDEEAIEEKKRQAREIVMQETDKALKSV